jgi:hypothetical protein
MFLDWLYIRMIISKIVSFFKLIFLPCATSVVETAESNEVITHEEAETIKEVLEATETIASVVRSFVGGEIELDPELQLQSENVEDTVDLSSVVYPVRPTSPLPPDPTIPVPPPLTESS